jgi:hypothetical protein
MRIAVVGSGPAGFYAAGQLLNAAGLSIDTIARLPTPWGLVRAGVAPDHPKIKSVTRGFETIAAPELRDVCDVVVDPAEVSGEGRNAGLLRDYATRPRTGHKRVALRFLRSPAEITAGAVKIVRKKCAQDTVDKLLADIEAGRLLEPVRDDVPPALAAAVTYDGWKRIDEHEQWCGRPVGRPRVKLTRQRETVAIAGAD